MRECMYKGVKYHFHGFFQRAYVREESLMLNGFPPRQEAFPVALIESKDGGINWVDASQIRFVEDNYVERTDY